MRKLLGILFCIIAPLTICSMASAAGKVLLVHSYHAGYAWADAIITGVKKGLVDSGAQLEIFYMDTKRNTSEAWKVEAGQMAKENVASFKPDVVIAADDNAQAYFAKDYVGKLRSPVYLLWGKCRTVDVWIPVEECNGDIGKTLLNSEFRITSTNQARRPDYCHYS